MSFVLALSFIYLIAFVEACFRTENHLPPHTKSAQFYEGKYIENIATFTVYEVLWATNLIYSGGYLTVKEDKSRTPRMNVTCKSPFINAKIQTLPTYHRNIGVGVLCYDYIAKFRVGLLQVPCLVCIIKYYQIQQSEMCELLPKNGIYVSGCPRAEKSCNSPLYTYFC